ncbi:MAG: DUF2934 domain-containing protein [Gammaproteobacteria bacterium]|nr:DUF2934 domain-containing protein [Gammaproteobacteria bacterium]
MTGSKGTSSGTTSAKKPIRRKTVAKTTSKKNVAQKTAAKKTKTLKVGATKKKPVPVCTSKERHQMIATAAYFIAESRGFKGGSSEQDWLDAAEKIDSSIINA